MHGYTDKYTPSVGEGHITIFPWHYSSITQGTWGWSEISSQVYYGWWYNSSNTQNDQIDYKVYLDVGTYTLKMLSPTVSSRAISTFLIDGASIGTMDWYAAETYNVIKSITAISVASAGLKTLSMKAATRNGSATQWYLTPTSLSLYRTA